MLQQLLFLLARASCVLLKQNFYVLSNVLELIIFTGNLRWKIHSFIFSHYSGIKLLTIHTYEHLTIPF